MPFEIKPAVRQGIKPLIGLSGVSGGGKSRTALLLARGMAGPKGRITLVDSENGRGNIFADVIPGGYFVLPLGEPFSSENYHEAFVTAEENSEVVIFDSVSHEWASVLEFHEKEIDRLAKGSDEWEKRKAVTFTAWIKPKKQHKDFLDRVLRSRVPIIFCFRAETKTKIGKDKNGKTEVKVSELPEPIYDPRFFYELLICANVYSINGKGGYLDIFKITHEELCDCLPAENHQMSIEHGEAIARWAAGGSKPAPANQSQGLHAGSKTRSERDKLVIEIWALTEPIHHCQRGDSEAIRRRGQQMVTQYLIDENIISDTEELTTLTEQRLREVIPLVTAKLNRS